MESSLKLNRKEIRQIELIYDLTVKSSFFLGVGSGNTNFCIETNIGRCVFSVIEEQNRDEVEIMANTLVWLEAHNYETSLLIKPKLQESYSITLRGKPSLLRTYMEGEVVQDLSENTLCQLGIAVAKLHAIPIPHFLECSIFYEQKKFMDALEADMDQDYEGWAKSRLRDLAVERFSDLPTSIIHSDLFYDNILCSEDQFACMIDFELACVYHSVFDIAMAMVGTCSADGKLSTEKARHLISGYQSLRVIEENEIEALKTYTEYAAILTSIWRYWRYRIYQPNNDNSGKYLEMVKLAKSIENADFNEFADVFIVNN